MLYDRERGFDGYQYAAMVHLNNENVTYFQVLASNDRYFTFRGKQPMPPRVRRRG